jgi:hypothetical protein
MTVLCCGEISPVGLWCGTGDHRDQSAQASQGWQGFPRGARTCIILVVDGNHLGVFYEERNLSDTSRLPKKSDRRRKPSKSLHAWAVALAMPKFAGVSHVARSMASFCIDKAKNYKPPNLGPISISTLDIDNIDSLHPILPALSRYRLFSHTSSSPTCSHIMRSMPV